MSMGFDIVTFFAGIVVGGFIGGYLVYKVGNSITKSFANDIDEEVKKLKSVIDDLRDVDQKIKDAEYIIGRILDDANHIKNALDSIAKMEDVLSDIRSDLNALLDILNEKFKWTVRIEMEGKKDEQHA